MANLWPDYPSGCNGSKTVIATTTSTTGAEVQALERLLAPRNDVRRRLRKPGES